MNANALAYGSGPRKQGAFPKIAPVKVSQAPVKASQNNTLKYIERENKGGPGGLAPPVLVDMADRHIKKSADII